MGGSGVATATSHESVEAVWALVADIAGWPTWGPPSRASKVKDGAPDASGVGSQWRIGIGPLTDVYEILVFEPPHHLAYGLVSGLPIRGHRADVVLAAATGGGTTITWSASWDHTPPPSALWARALQRAAQKITTALAQAHPAPG